MTAARRAPVDRAARFRDLIESVPARLEAERKAS